MKVKTRIAVFAVVFLLLSGSALGQCVVPPPGLVGWWPGDGNANDLIGGANGALRNGAAFAPSGKVGQAFTLDGLSQTVDLPVMNVGRTFTIDFWVFPTKAGSFQHLASNDYSSGNFGALYLNGSHLEYYQNSGLKVSTSTGSVPLNTWTHVALTYDALYVRLYVNGVPDGTSDLHVETFNNGLRLGFSFAGGDSFFGGLLDEVEIFNRALTPAEVQAIVAADSSGKCKNGPFINAPAALPEGIGLGGSYFQTFTAALGTPPYMFSLASGVLPSGLGFSGGGVLTGSPFTAGMFPLDFLVTDSAGRSSLRSYVLSVVACSTPPANLAGWWPGDGHANDLVGGNNGIPHNATFAAAGKVAQSFKLNGIDQWVDVAPMNLGGFFSVGFWVFPTRMASFQHLVSNHFSSANFGALYLHLGRVQYWQGGVQRVGSLTGLPLNAWSHVMLVYDGVARLYIDGSLSALSGPHSEVFSNGLRFGSSNPQSDNLFEGSLDEVEVFSRALTGSEVASIHGAGSGGTCKPGCPGGLNITGTIPNFCQGASQPISLGLNGSNLEGAAITWALDGVTLGTSSTLATTLSGLSLGSHNITATVALNSCAPVSTSIAFSISAPPSISTSPASATRCVGDSVSFSVSAGGTPPLAYQWRKNSSNIYGATGSMLVIAAVALGDAGSYDVIVSNACGSSAPSAPATLAVTTPPLLTAGSNGPICPGQTLQLTASAVQGGTYAWTGPNGFSSSLQNPSILNATVSASGVYTVTVAGGGCSSSAQVMVAITPPPSVSISGAPSAPVCAGTPVTLSANVANGIAPFTYVWMRNGIQIATAASITDAPTTTSNYSVTVSDAKSCTSATGSAVVMINPTPTAAIAGTPAGGICLGSRVNLSASYAPSGGAVTFSWSKNGVALGVSESVSDTPGLGTTVYSLLVTRNGCVSSSAKVSVNVFDYALSLTPAAQTVVRGASATYTLAAKAVAGSAGAPSSLALSLSGVPPDATVTGFPTSLPLTTAGSEVPFSIQTGPTSLGKAVIAVTGTAGCTRTSSADLNIMAFSLNGFVAGPNSDPLSGNKLDVVFTPDKKATCGNLRADQLPAQKISSTNPGTQILVLQATRLDPGATAVTFNIKMPGGFDSSGVSIMPGFVLKGSMPVQVFDALPSQSGKNLNSTVTDYQVTVCSDVNCQSAADFFKTPGKLQPLSNGETRARTIRLTVPFPASNTVVVTIHLAYGLKLLAPDCWPAQSGSSFFQSYTFTADVGTGGSLLPNAIVTSVVAAGKK